MSKIISKWKVRKQKKPKTRIASYKVFLLPLLFLLSILHLAAKVITEKAKQIMTPPFLKSHLRFPSHSE